MSPATQRLGLPSLLCPTPFLAEVLCSNSTGIRRHNRGSHCELLKISLSVRLAVRLSWLSQASCGSMTTQNVAECVLHYSRVLLRIFVIISSRTENDLGPSILTGDGAVSGKPIHGTR